MTEMEIDQRLKALFARGSFDPDPVFIERVLALAAFEQAERQAQRRAFRDAWVEGVGLMVVLTTFALLAWTEPAPADLQSLLSLASPAPLGLIIVGLWAIVAVRPAACDR